MLSDFHKLFYEAQPLLDGDFIRYDNPVFVPINYAQDVLMLDVEFSVLKDDFPSNSGYFGHD